MTLARWLIACAFFFLVPMAAAQGPPEAAPETAADISEIIKMLEDDQERARILKLLRLMAAQEAGAEEEPAARDWEDSLLGLAGSAWQGLEVSGAGLIQAFKRASLVLGALFTPLALELWPPYFLAVCGWGLFWLLAAWVLARRWGRFPPLDGSPGFSGRLKIFSRHFLIRAAPGLILIVSLILWPEPSSTASGVTADLAWSLSFLEVLVKGLFIYSSILHIALKAASALLAPLGEGPETLSGLSAPLARRLLSSWNFLAVHMTALAFIKDVFLDQFVLGRTYEMALLVLVAPIPLALTGKLWRLKSALAVRGEEETDGARQVYLTDRFVEKCWVFLSIGAVWLAAGGYILAAGAFWGRLAGSLAIFGLAVGVVMAARFLPASLAGPPRSEEGRRLLVSLDALAALAAALAAFLLVLAVWGLPLGRLLESGLAREILGRLLIIVLTVTALVLFLKFSRLATEWLLAVPALSGNRNWRTMAPLFLTGVRALGIFLAVVVVLELLGVNVGPILAGAGILGLGVGLGAQSLVKDFINGVSILSMDIIAVGDSVTIGGHNGTVDKVGLRSLRLRDANWNLIMIPNSSIDMIVNRTRGLAQSLLEVVMPPDAEPDELLALARAVADEFNADADWSPRLASPVTVVGVTDFSPGGTTIRLRLVAPAGEQWEPEWELRRRLKQRLLQAGHDSRAFAQVVVNIPPDGGKAPE